jgi:predicted nucleotide-binding protein
MSRRVGENLNGRRIRSHQRRREERASTREGKAGAHSVAVRRKQAKSDVSVRRPANSGTASRVFIGHGRSSAWRELKDFLHDRLGLPWDEFNRIPVAGYTNIERLSQMLATSSLALIVMTGDDEIADGKMQARMNVAHEAGLAQGRLGFNKAILLLEEGCREFSNIQGLGQIRFPKGNISAAFEEVRRVLEREYLI